MHSLIRFEERIERLLFELGDTHWDILIFSETWREGRVETWETESGHNWFGSGGTKGERGVGFLLHKRWQALLFKPLSDRVAVLDLRIASKRCIRVIAVYMPHSGHKDEDVDVVYSALDVECKEARSKHSSLLIAGDFNAEVGTCVESDDHRIIGCNPCIRRSQRGAQLLLWCTFHKLALANTFSSESLDMCWTYKNAESFKVLDYFALDTALVKYLSSCFVLSSVDIGSDHRPLICILRFCEKVRRTAIRHRCKRWANDPGFITRLDGFFANRVSNPSDVQSKFDLIQEGLTHASVQPKTTQRSHLAKEIPAVDDVNGKLHKLIAERRQLNLSDLSAGEKKNLRVCLGKQIQHLIRRRIVLKKSARIQSVLADFRGLKQLPFIITGRRTGCIAEVRRTDGSLCNTKSDIANVFAKFYEDLYQSRALESRRGAYERSSENCAEPFSLQELQDSLKGMSGGKASDSAGIVVEMLKTDCHALQCLILELFNDVLASPSQVPHQWLTSRLVVIFKKGDPTLPANYRPIAILSILYKLFSCMLHGRLVKVIMPHLSTDQAAYRKGFSTEDHLLSTILLLERCSEWNVELWLGLCDFRKAFDTVEHASLWSALLELKVDEVYIDLLRGLYRSQTATVFSGADSEPFDIGRGVKQGDPLSPLLFLCIIEIIFRRLKLRWKKLNSRRSGLFYGVVVDDPENPLFCLQFADDVLLLASNRGDIGKMILDLQREALRFGLELHTGKTVVLTNTFDNRPSQIRCGAQTIRVLAPDEAENYLGRQLAVQDSHAVEIKSRVSRAWGVFFKFQSVLCDRRVPIYLRIRFFEAVIVPCVLYACGTWTLTTDDERLLISTRRRMLRWIVGLPRSAGEAWVDYVQRSTHIAEELFNTRGSCDWVSLQRRRKWMLAGRFAAATDQRWSRRLLDWLPWHRIVPRRSVGHPRKRWADDIVNIAGGDWSRVAQSKEQWSALIEGFVYRL